MTTTNNMKGTENIKKLRIFIYGKKALEDLLHINKTIEIKICEDVKYKIKPYIGGDKILNWDYFIFQSEINDEANDTINNYLKDDYQSENELNYNDEIQNIILNHLDLEEANSCQINEDISKTLLKYNKFYDILVICVDNLLDEDSQLAFKYFQGLSQNRSQQPIILFLTKKDNNPKISDLFQFITNEFYDKRNVYALKFPSNDTEKKLLDDFFNKCMNYFNEMSNDSNYEINTFNILICGQAGVGKSTFINKFMQEKVAKEGEGLSITHKVTHYVHPKYPIRIYDTPGFESDGTVNIVRKTIEKLDKNMLDSNKHIDLILYFCKLQSRNFLAIEINLIKWLIKENKNIIFVLNDFDNNKKTDIIRLTEVLKDSIKKIITTMDNNKNILQDNILDNFVSINLRQSLYEYEDEKEEIKTIIKQCYGMDILCKKIYDIFIKHKISISEIESANNTKEILSKIKKYKLLGGIYDFIKFHINKKIESIKLILYYSYQDYFVWLMKNKRRNELIQKINELYKGDVIDDIDTLRENLKSQVDNENNKKEIIEDFLESVKIYKEIFEADGYYLNSSDYNENTFMIGYLFLKPFLNKYNQNDTTLTNSVKEISLIFNKAIDGFKELSQEWENVYNSLKFHKSDTEWIKKYFILEIPKEKD